ncbi:MAG: PD-(D/E)XK nuclease family protein [Bryobacterales bacterium]|nr:PD-(D/E)XK nuclease family protein [Bryobacterales bacterium]
MLLIGPPGSGKTKRILSDVERAVRGGRGDEVLLLVPTASMRAHMLSTLARRGLTTPARTVTTISEFVTWNAPDLSEPGRAWEDRLLAQVLSGTVSAWLRGWAGSARLRSRISALMRELWAVGADSYQLEPAVRGAQQAAFLEVFREFETALAREGRVHQNQRTAIVAASLRERGLRDVQSVYVDGFEQFTLQQEELLSALEEQAEEFVLAMPEGLPSYPPFNPQVVLPPAPSRERVCTHLIRAASPRAEILEIARRILASGRPMREHAVIVRSPERYDDLLREVFESLEIPHRFWGRGPVSGHGVARHFLGWLRLIHRQFPGEQSLEAITSPLSPVESPDQADAFDFAARELLPGSGLSFLDAAAAEFPAIRQLIGQLRPCRQWYRRRVGAKRWGRDCLALLDRLQALRPPPEPGDFRRTLDWREALAARRAVRRAIEEAVSMPDFKGRKRPSLAAFADAVEDVLRSDGGRAADQRVDVVHILPVGEARQWSVPVAFVCGLAEGWFPRTRSQDVFFNDRDRQRLHSQGIHIRTTMQLAEQERLRFQVASTRGSHEQVLSYPCRDSAGRELQPSDFLRGMGELMDCPHSLLGCAGQAVPPQGAGQLRESLLNSVAARNASFSASGIADYRQCPYLYFSSNTLALRGRPPEPAERLDRPAVGQIVHRVLDLWNSGRGDIGGLLDEAFQAKLAELHLQPDYGTERIRLAVRADLVRFAGKPMAAMALPPESSARFEESVGLRIDRPDSRPLVRCRIDRYDVDSAQRCLVTDYKYAPSDRVKKLLARHLKGEELQLSLYLAALEQERGLEPAGMLLVGLRGETSMAGASVSGTGGLRSLTESDLQELLNHATEEAKQAVGEVLGGRIAVLPRDQRFCQRSCQFRAVCRVGWKKPDATASRPAAPT